MEAAQVDRSPVRVLLNRWEAGGMGPADVATAIGCEVAAVFPNDYRAVNAAILNKSFVDPGSRLGKAYRSFAARLVEDPETSSASSKLSLFLKPFRLPLASHARQRA
jgi:hypothetical protein